MTTTALINWPADGSSRGRAFLPSDFQVIEPPTVPVLSLADARRAVKQDAWMGGDPAKPDAMGHPDDIDIMDHVAAATGELSVPTGWLGRSIMPQTLEVRLSSFAAVDLPAPPVIEVLAVTITGADGAPVVLDAAAYRLVSAEPYARLEPVAGAVIPSGSAVVRYRAGYEPPEADGLTHPELALIRSWVRLRLNDLYSNGGTMSKMGEAPFAAHLLTNLRVRT